MKNCFATIVYVVVNADHNFVYFYPKEKVVVAPKDMERVAGKINSDMKSGFNAMVTYDLESIKKATPFVVYNGTKLKDVNNKTTNTDWKFRNWREPSNGRTSNRPFIRSIVSMTTLPFSTLTSFST